MKDDAWGASVPSSPHARAINPSLVHYGPDGGGGFTPVATPLAVSVGPIDPGAYGAESFQVDPHEVWAEPPGSSSGPATPRGSIALTLEDDESAGLTASEQWGLMKQSRSLRRLLLLDGFMAILMIPLFDMSGLLLLYMISPIVGFLGSRFYHKGALRVYLVLNVLVTIFWLLFPLFPFSAETGVGSALFLWFFYLAIRAVLTWSSFQIFRRLQPVSAADCTALSDMHLRGEVSVR